MAKLVKILAIVGGMIVGLGVLAAIALVVFFDPNDFREQISAQVKKSTGRDLVIEGGLSVSFFPWLAVEIGKTSLGNAAGFGDDPFIRFDSARLSVQVLPLLLRQEISVGTATLEGFAANLAVARNGTTNWDDLAAGGEDETLAAEPAEASSFKLDIANVRLGDARITYSDAQSGSSYTITGLTVTTGRVALGEAFPVDAEFEFAAAPGELGGNLSLSTTVTVADGMQQLALDGLTVSGKLRGVVEQPTEFRLDSRGISIDTAAQRLALGELDLGVLGLSMSANVEPLSYAGTPQPVATLRIADFSLKDLMRTLGIEAPVTADPNAMTTVSFGGRAAVGEEAMVLDEMSLKLDDTTMTGRLSVPLNENGFLTFDLVADSITLDNYMAPADGAAADEDDAAAADMEIPVDLIRSLKARGTARLGEAFLGPIRFTNLQLGLNGADGKLRLSPISAEFFDGGYQGDVRVDASGGVPVLSVNENIRNVNLGSMAKAIFETDNVTGTINGSFVLSGAGGTISAIRSDLDGNMSIELADGAWEGVDVWHQLRTARALYKQEPPPEPKLPARTPFSNVRAAGVVTDGVFANNDLVAELPFLRVTGSGKVDLVKTELDYSVQARVLEKPELMGAISAEEMEDFTKVLIPIRIRGPLASPSFRPDIEAMFRQEVERAIDEKKEDLKKDLLNRLIGEPKDDTEGAAGEGADTEPQKEEAPDLEEEVKKKLKDLFPR